MIIDVCFYLVIIRKAERKISLLQKGSTLFYVYVNYRCVKLHFISGPTEHIIR